jgi:uncharacterized protein (TIGR02757 family)
MIEENIKDFLEEKYIKFNNKNFIEVDPIQIPHLYSKKQDIEIAAFLTATIAWGQRKSIIQNATKLMDWMENMPHEFILGASEKELKPFKKFVHRTFNGEDCIFFIHALRVIYQQYDSMEYAFSNGLKKNENIKNAIVKFRTEFLKIKHQQRVEKHLSNPDTNSSAKRLSMFLRWMVRKDKAGVDFGIWKSISPSQLCLPLDVHTGNVSRKLGLLMRKQNDWKSVEEITTFLKTLDNKDPVKYDFALFGLGAFEKF